MMRSRRLAASCSIAAALWSTSAIAAHPPETPEPDDAAQSAPADPAPQSSDDADETVRVVTVPTRSDGMTASGRTIDADTIASMPKRSAEDLLRLVPGMVIVQHGNQGKGQQFYLRGFDAEHGSDIELTMQDIPLNEASNVHAHGYLDLAFVIPEVVDGVDAKKGSYRLEQGNFGTAGTIGYRLGVRGPQRGVRTTYEIGSTNRHRGVVVFAPKGQPDATFVALEAMRDGGYGENRVAHRLNALSQVRLFQHRGAYVDGLGGVYSARFGLPGTVRFDDVNRGAVGVYDAYLHDTKGESDIGLLGLRTGLDRRKVHFGATGWARARRLVLDENFTGDLLFPATGDRHRQQQESITAGARVHYEHDVHDKVQIRAVTEVRGDVIDQRQDQLTVDARPWSVARDLDINQLHFGVGAGVRALPVEWFTIDGGVRFDVFHYEVLDHLQDDRRFTGDVFAASPRTTMRFTPGERWQIFAAYGRGLRSPEARAFTLPTETPADVPLSRYAGGRPRMTLTDGTEVGARVQPGDLFDIGVAAFGTWIQRESVFDHVSGFNIERSATQRLGIEGDIQLRPTRWLMLGADITAVRARFRESGAPIPGAPPIVTSVIGSVTHPKGFRAGLRWFLLGPRPLSYGARAGVVTVMDLNLGYRWRFLQADLAIDNVFGLRWREGEYNFASHWDPSRPASNIPTIHYVTGYPLGVRLGLTGFF